MIRIPPPRARNISAKPAQKTAKTTTTKKIKTQIKNKPMTQTAA